MKFLLVLITILIFAVGGLMFSNDIYAFFNIISSSLDNKIIYSKSFSPQKPSFVNHLVISEVLYETTDSQDIYKQGGKNRGQWVEIYNPTSSPVDISNWSLEDDSGLDNAEKLEGIMPPNGFALIIALGERDFRRFWNISPEVILIQASSAKIGNGLNSFGDRILLKDRNGQIIDRMSWGKNISGFSAGCKNLCSVAPAGESLNRSPITHDRDLPTDFISNKHLTPGSNIL